MLDAALGASLTHYDQTKNSIAPCTNNCNPSSLLTLLAKQLVTSERYSKLYFVLQLEVLWFVTAS